MIKLSNRLYACSSIIREGKRLCDVGCDHGYIPAYLVSNGIIPSAVACDINEGPLNSCKSLVTDMGLEDKIKCVLSNGLENIDENDVDDILIAGMGGELIVNIISACDWVKSKHIVVNPMTHPEIVRRYFYSNGYEIRNDIIVSDLRHHYSVFDAYYTGVVSEKTKADYFLGNITDFSDKEYFKHLLNYLNNKQKGGEDFSEVIKAIEEKI